MLVVHLDGNQRSVVLNDSYNDASLSLSLRDFYFYKGGLQVTGERVETHMAWGGCVDGRALSINVRENEKISLRLPL